MYKIELNSYFNKGGHLILKSNIQKSSFVSEAKVIIFALKSIIKF